jgi:alpha-acetolactate decarboxylase
MYIIIDWRPYRRERSVAVSLVMWRWEQVHGVDVGFYAPFAWKKAWQKGTNADFNTYKSKYGAAGKILILIDSDLSWL